LVALISYVNEDHISNSLKTAQNFMLALKKNLIKIPVSPDADSATEKKDKYYVKRHVRLIVLNICIT